MTYAGRAQVAETIHDGEYWLRCPFCGDSENDDRKAHYSIQMSTGIYFCLRCNASGRISKQDQYRMFGQMPISAHAQDDDEDSEDKFYAILDNLREGAPWPRPSLLPRWTYEDESHRPWDAFLSYDLSDGEPIGVSLRLADTQKKVAYFYGTRGFAWAGDSLPSSAVRPLRLVEGPYDVLTTSDVVVFGTMGKHTMSEFVGHNLILCPDGDIWQKPKLTKAFMTLLRYLLYNDRFAKPHLVGVEYLPDGLDPDEVLPGERMFLDREAVTQLLKRRS